MTKLWKTSRKTYEEYMKKREVWVTEIPLSDGREQHGTRPAIVIAEPIANTVLIIPCTSNEKAANYKGTVPLKPRLTNGLSVKTIALVFQMRAIDAKRVRKRIGTLAPSEYEPIRKEILKLVS